MECLSFQQPPCQEDIDFVTDACTQMAIGFLTEWTDHQETEGTEERLQKLITVMNGSACLMLSNLVCEKRKLSGKNDERHL